MEEKCNFNYYVRGYAYAAKPKSRYKRISQYRGKRFRISRCQAYKAFGRIVHGYFGDVVANFICIYRKHVNGVIYQFGQLNQDTKLKAYRPSVHLLELLG